MKITTNFEQTLNLSQQISYACECMIIQYPLHICYTIRRNLIKKAGILYKIVYLSSITPSHIQIQRIDNGDIELCDGMEYVFITKLTAVDVKLYKELDTSRVIS